MRVQNESTTNTYRVNFKIDEWNSYCAYLPKKVDGTYTIVTIPDACANDNAFQTLLNSGGITVLSYDTEDTEDNTSYVAKQEFNDGFAKCIYKVSTPVVTGTIDFHTEAMTHFVMTNVAVTTIDLTVHNKLYLKFDSLYELEVTIPPAQHTTTTVVSALNADTEFAKWCVASKSTVGDDDFLVLTSKSYGENANIELLDRANNCHTELGLVDATTEAGTGVPAVVTIAVKNPGGLGLNGIAHQVKIYDAATAGALHTKAKVQRILKGTYVSGMYTNTLNAISDVDGNLQFEVITSSAFSHSETAYCIVTAITDYFLASFPTDRTEIYTAPGT